MYDKLRWPWGHNWGDRTLLVNLRSLPDFKVWRLPLETGRWSFPSLSSSEDESSRVARNLSTRAERDFLDLKSWRACTGWLSSGRSFAPSGSEGVAWRRWSSWSLRRRNACNSCRMALTWTVFSKTLFSSLARVISFWSSVNASPRSDVWGAGAASLGLLKTPSSRYREVLCGEIS